MLFAEEELIRRKNWQSKIAALKTNILFSSFDALNDFKKFYPQAQCRLFVVPFTVSHPDFQDISINDLREKFNIKGNYFFSPNQFWKHKNHQLVLNALLILKKTGIKTQVVFTGKEEDYRNPEYFPSLKRFINENDLAEYVKFLGFIDRKEQLQLMKNSFAVIQPSLFEGWSTVVEDAKAMNQFVILSNLPVHQEQIQKNVCFFDPYNAEDLAKKINLLLENPPEREIVPYDKDIFGKKFLEILKCVKNV
jgi:glycosyltransferase involved in cell wall biosynthesis